MLTDIRERCVGMRANDWYMLRAQPKIACDLIAKWQPQIETYYPVAKTTRIIRHEVVPEERPAYGYYLFARCSGAPNWLILEERCGAQVLRALNFNGEREPLWAPDHIVQRERKRELAGEFNDTENAVCPAFELKVGSMQYISAPGPFFGEWCTIKAVYKNHVKARMSRSGMQVKLPINMIFQG